MKKVTKTAWAIAAVVLFAGAGCSDDNGDIVLPPIGGYNNSNEVAAANLKTIGNLMALKMKISKVLRSPLQTGLPIRLVLKDRR